MLQEIFSLFRSGTASAPSASQPQCWIRDPLSHPDIARMDARALADLPFALFPAPKAPQACEEDVFQRAA